VQGFPVIYFLMTVNPPPVKKRTLLREKVYLSPSELLITKEFVAVYFFKKK